MKKIFFILLAMSGMIFFSCSTNKNPDTNRKYEQEEIEKPTDEPNDPIGGCSESINPEKNDLFFGAKGDTVLIKTENEFVMGYIDLPLKDDEDMASRHIYWPIGNVRDTITLDWGKAIALEGRVEKLTDMSITHSKLLKVIVFDNPTNQKRNYTITLTHYCCGDQINVYQEGL